MWRNSTPARAAAIGALALFQAGLPGCAEQGYSVIASTATTIGVGLAQQPANGGLDATLGYKRAEVAFVPTNRDGGVEAGNAGQGARDSANVIMELHYRGLFSTGSDSGIYQRLAVGDLAVRQPGASVMLVRKADGSVDPSTLRALRALEGVPLAAPESTAALSPLAKRYGELKQAGKQDALAAFDEVARQNGYSSFGQFLLDTDAPPEKIERVRRALEERGFSFE